MGRRGNKFVWVLFVIALVMVAVSIFFVFGKEKPLNSVEYDVKFIVRTGGIGFDLDNSVLTFGAVNPGGGAKREVVIDNSYSFPFEVRTLVSENLLGLLEVDTGFVVGAGKNVTIPVSLNVPTDFELGNYTGKIRFDIYEYKE